MLMAVVRAQEKEIAAYRSRLLERSQRKAEELRSLSDPCEQAKRRVLAIDFARKTSSVFERVRREVLRKRGVAIE